MKKRDLGVRVPPQGGFGIVPFHAQYFPMAAGDDNEQVRVLGSPSAKKLADKMYQLFISDTDYTKFPAFFKQLDQMLVDFGGHVLQDDPSVPQQEEPPTPAPVNQQQAQQQGPADGNHDEVESASILEAVSKFLLLKDNFDPLKDL
jgi:hypothetical protein